MTRFSDGSAGDADYGRIGTGYAKIRQPDPRIATQFHEPFGDARLVLNVGAGAGSYEPTDRIVTAIEPSKSMRAQRPQHLAPAIDGISDHLPFDDDAFDASMASVTIHQWKNLETGLGEMRRVTRDAVVILTFDPVAPEHWWIMDYVPQLLEIEARRMPAIDRVAAAIGADSEVRTLLIPYDCTDGFVQAFYARPERLLDPEVRLATSAWSFLDDGLEEAFVEKLSADLQSGDWDEKYGRFRYLTEFDGGLRLVIGRSA